VATLKTGYSRLSGRSRLAPSVISTTCGSIYTDTVWAVNQSRTWSILASFGCRACAFLTSFPVENLLLNAQRCAPLRSPVVPSETLPTEGKLPSRMAAATLQSDLEKIATIIERMADPDIFVWLEQNRAATDTEVHRAATIVADRLCGAVANPIIRNGQERRQLAAIEVWLQGRGYQRLPEPTKYDSMLAGTYSFRLNVPVKSAGRASTINIPIDTAVMPLTARSTDLPLMIEAKSAGDFTNTNKRGKEEAQKINQLRHTFGDGVRFVLFLCGYFDSGYLGYEASELIDWVWEHRIDDLAEFGI
jgi:XamI restriction endonuclease